MLPRRLVPIALMVLVAACGDDIPDVRRASPSTSPTVTASSGPPPVVVRWDGGELVLAPWTFCYGYRCVDGMTPENPPSVGDPAEVSVGFAEEAWSFEATLRPVAQSCGREEVAAVDADGRLVPHGRAGEKYVTLFGRGPGGDVSVSFRWTTPVDGPRTPPGSTASIVADHDGVPDSYGVELGAHHLAATPTAASAAVVVTAANGASKTLVLRRVDTGCADDSSVGFDAPKDEGVVAAHLGDPPFTYDVTLTLDGTVHRASATWPAGQDPECAPCVPLQYDPPLPALDGG